MISGFLNITRGTFSIAASFLPSTTIGRVATATITGVALIAMALKYAPQPLLLKGIEKNSPTLVKIALLGGANPNEEVENALENGDLSTIKLLLNAGAKINVNEEMKKALEKGNLSTIRLLIKVGAKIKVSDKYGHILLHEAIIYRDTEVIIALGEAGVDVDAPNGYGSTPLHNAAATGNTEIVIALVKALANVNAPNRYGWTPLHDAAVKGNTETVIALIEVGAKVDARNWSADTPLHYAAMKGNTETVIALLQAGAKVDACDNEGPTPLHYAAALGETEAINVLVKAGAKVNVKDIDGFTPLHRAARGGRTGAIIDLLLAGANPRTANIEAHIALADIPPNIIECLQRNYGSTPLHYAAINGDIQAFRNADIAQLNAPNIAGVTPLHLAARYGHLNIVKYLFSKGANPFVRDRDGNTALHYSFMSEKIEMSKNLIKFADTLGEIKNKQGKTPFDLNPEKMKELKQAHESKKEGRKGLKTAYSVGAPEKSRDVIREISKFLGGTDQELQFQYNTVLMRKAKNSIAKNKGEKIQNLLNDHPRLMDFKDFQGKTLLDDAREKPYLYKYLYPALFRQAGS